MERSSSSGMVHTVNVESIPDSNAAEECSICNSPAEQRRIDYKLLLNQRLFRVPGVWANVCTAVPDEHIFFEPSVGKVIMKKIYKIQDSEELRLISSTCS